MAFSYWEYFIYNLMLPVFGIAFVAVPTFRLVMRVLEQYATGRQRVKWDGQSVVFFVLMVVIGVVLAVNLFTSKSIHLAYERPKAAVTVEGTLEQVKAGSVWSGNRYTYNGENTYGYTYIVDGVEMKGMAKGTLEPGEQVTVTYLPKSGYVLAIEEQ